MLRRLACGIAACAALLIVLVLPAAAQQRIALVVGNAAYPKGPLQTSLADGGLVAEALQSVGFEIVEGADTNLDDMRRVFGEFVQKVQAAGPDTIAFVYYSGYGLEFDGDNYLIPVSAQLARDTDIPNEAARLLDLLGPLADAPAGTKIVVLDATRPLPFRIEGGQIASGLGAIEAAPGMLVAFSSAPGTSAQDGAGPYGAYATAIAEMVREPGLDIDTLFARVRLRTVEATNGVQTPWEVSQLQQVAMLVPGQAASPPAGAPQGLLAPQTQIGAPIVRRAPPPRPVVDLGADEAYAYAIQRDDLATYVEFVRVYPTSPYAPRVWAMIRARREALLWRRVLLDNTPDAYWTYIQRYPNGMYVFDARRRLRRLAAADIPPPGFRMRMWDDVPMPLTGEPVGIVGVLPVGPPPRRYLPPPPALLVGLPPPQRPGQPGLWRRQQVLPAIIPPRPQNFQRPPAIANQPPAAIGGPKRWPQQNAPAIVNRPPAGGPPPGFKGQFQKPPAVANQPPPGGPPQGFKGQFQKGQPVVNQPPAGFKGEFRKGPPGPPGGGVASAPPNVPKNNIVNQPKPPVAAAPPPPRPPVPPPAALQAQKGPGGGAPGGGAQKGPGGGAPGGGAPKGQKKCVVLNGQPVCK
jgi:hypothetical protein